MILKSGRDAIFLLNGKNKTLESKGMEAFIPAYFVFCQGVIRNVPEDIPEEELQANIEILGHMRNTNTNMYPLALWFWPLKAEYS